MWLLNKVIGILETLCLGLLYISVFHILKTIYVLNDNIMASFNFDIAIVVFWWPLTDLNSSYPFNDNAKVNCYFDNMTTLL